MSHIDDCNVEEEFTVTVNDPHGLADTAEKIFQKTLELSRRGVELYIVQDGGPLLNTCSALGVAHVDHPGPVTFRICGGRSAVEAIMHCSPSGARLPQILAAELNHCAH